MAGILSGPGGQAVADALQGSGQQVGNGAALNKTLTNAIAFGIPMIMQAQARSKALAAQQAKFESEKIIMDEQQASLVKLAQGIEDPNLQNAVLSGQLKNQALVNAIQTSDQTEAVANIGQVMAANNPALAGYAGTDLVEQMAKASGGDFKKFENITGALEQSMLKGNLNRDADTLLDIQESIATKLNNPTWRETVLNSTSAQGGAKLDETVLPFMAIKQMREEGMLAKLSPQVRDTLLYKIGKSDPQGILQTLDDFAEEAYNGITELQDRQSKQAKTQAEINKANAQADQARATSGLQSEKIQTEKTKQTKNLREPSTTGQVTESQKDARSKALQKERRKIEQLRAKELGKKPVENATSLDEPDDIQNPTLLDTYEQQLQALDEELGNFGNPGSTSVEQNPDTSGGSKPTASPAPTGGFFDTNPIGKKLIQYLGN